MVQNKEKSTAKNAKKFSLTLIKKKNSLPVF